VQCEDGHYVCDDCHKVEAMEYIEATAIHSRWTNPMELLEFIMANPKIKLHGPEHHFLVSAVLLCAFLNKTNQADLLPFKLRIAKDRAKNIIGGFCGLYGNCGAAVGSGIFMSVLLNSTPLSDKEWRLSNLMTAASLHEIALNGGPRCCKRCSRIAVETAVTFVEKHLSISLDRSDIACVYSDQNKECTRNDCIYFERGFLGQPHHVEES
jgi:hypothetical protein